MVCLKLFLLIVIRLMTYIVDHVYIVLQLYSGSEEVKQHLEVAQMQTYTDLYSYTGVIILGSNHLNLFKEGNIPLHY
jgi:hypothetical protein